MTKIEELCELLKKAGAEAELGSGHYYLIHYSVDGGVPMSLMQDLGITWEPAKAYPTPRYCTIDLTDLTEAALKMLKIARAVNSKELALNAPDGSGESL